MSEKKVLNQEELEKVSGGSGFENIIIMQIKVTFKPDEEAIKTFSQMITQTFSKRYTAYVSDTEIEDACKEWCEDNHVLFVSYEVISQEVA